MNSLTNLLRDWWSGIRGGWERFWFVPDSPHTLALLRILAGCLFFYTH